VSQRQHSHHVARAIDCQQFVPFYVGMASSPLAACQNVSASGLKLPAVNSRRSEERMPTPEQVAALVAAAPEKDQAIWATAAFAGLRLGELQAVRCRDLDLKTGVIRVRRSYQRKHGMGDTKSYAGERDVPVFAALRPYVEKCKLGSRTILSLRLTDHARRRSTQGS
jgi:integrase